jgi:hypothetical protein
MAFICLQQTSSNLQFMKPITYFKLFVAGMEVSGYGWLGLGLGLGLGVVGTVRLIVYLRCTLLT